MQRFDRWNNDKWIVLWSDYTYNMDILFRTVMVVVELSRYVAIILEKKKKKETL